MFAFGRKAIANRFRAGKNLLPREKWIAPRLNNRIQILNPSQTEEDTGALSQTYTALKTIWASFTPLTHNSYRKWSSIESFESVSHEFIIRCSAVEDLNTEYGKGFDSSFDSIADLRALGQNYYLLVEKGSSVKGRLFRIRRLMNADENDEYYSILAEEIEEIGTGGSYSSDYIG